MNEDRSLSSPELASNETIKITEHETFQRMQRMLDTALPVSQT